MTYHSGPNSLFLVSGLHNIGVQKRMGLEKLKLLISFDASKFWKKFVIRVGGRYMVVQSYFLYQGCKEHSSNMVSNLAYPYLALILWFISFGRRFSPRQWSWVFPSRFLEPVQTPHCWLCTNTVWWMTKPEKNINGRSKHKMNN